ncbi:MAG: hypothetical protein MUE60_13280 [Candidatus Eisenbacteria bacterium]|nr:hypothetical protein [Candidatus Eisenbacteria bacterium]
MGVLAWTVAVAALEMRTSRIQARVFSGMAAGLSYRVGDGPSPAIRFPGHGPYDVRMGYARIPEWQTRLNASGYEVRAQARWSAGLLRHVEKGLFPPYAEKTKAGIALYDHREIC